jgi:hypothetical protein
VARFPNGEKALGDDIELETPTAPQG